MMRKVIIHEIALREERTKEDFSTLVAKIEENGDLMLEGYDLGESPKKFWGDSDYEYWRTVEKKYKDTILLWLIKERFNSDSDFSDWLEEKGIPSKFMSWI